MRLADHQLNHLAKRTAHQSLINFHFSPVGGHRPPLPYNAITAGPHRWRTRTAAAEPPADPAEGPVPAAPPLLLVRQEAAQMAAQLHRARARRRFLPSKRYIACHPEGTSLAAPCLRFVALRRREVFRPYPRCPPS